MEKKKKLLEVKDLKTHFFIEKEVAKAVNGVSFDVFEGETLGIVGESGSGKSVTAFSILRLIPDPPGKIVCGEINFRGRDLLKLSWEDVRKVRGNEISMIFQEPMTSLNPVFTIGAQIMEPILLHQKISQEEAKAKAVEMMELVGIPSSLERFDDFPYQFSGGMRQRVMIAMALACNPNLLIADEPTTALDVTIQAQILDLMADIRKKKPESAMMLITHDLAVVAEICSRVIVMYCGRIQEVADTVTLFKEPLHPYTRGLMASIPSLDTKKDRLYTIPGNVPSIMKLPQGCAFCTRCSKKMDICEKVLPDLVEIKPGHQVRCHLYSKSSEVK